MKKKSKYLAAIQDIPKTRRPTYKAGKKKKRRKNKNLKSAKKYLFKYLFKGIEVIGVISQIFQFFYHFFKR